jgi:hypothetical protein
MKLTGFAARENTHEHRTEVVVELDGIFYEAVRFPSDASAEEVADRLRFLASRILYRATHTPKESKP